MTLEARKVGHSVGGRATLSSVDLSFQPGRIYGLVGHNGSGKSTLLKLLARQLPASAGSVWLDNRPVSHWAGRQFARQVAYLPQHLPATDNLSGRELVAFGRYPHHGLLGRLAREDQRQIDRAMALTGTGVYADRLVDSLSGGERQRVWLAMLIAQKTRYLLLDEPLSALDIAYQVEILRLVRQLTVELSLGVIIVLHDVNMAVRACDELIALHTGSVMVQEPAVQFMKVETLHKVYGLTMQVHADACGRPIAMPDL